MLQYMLTHYGPLSLPIKLSDYCRQSFLIWEFAKNEQLTEHKLLSSITSKSCAICTEDGTNGQARVQTVWLCSPLPKHLHRNICVRKIRSNICKGTIRYWVLKTATIILNEFQQNWRIFRWLENRTVSCGELILADTRVRSKTLPFLSWTKERDIRSSLWVR